jgi:5'(3')-deoxyribonucleotidase
MILPKDMKKMKILALDVDDVCIDLMPEWLKQYNSDFDHNLKVTDITDWNISLFVKPEAKDKIYNYVRHSQIYENTKPVKNSLDSINKLRETWDRIIYITMNNIDDMKYQWLLNHKYIFDRKDFFVACDKSLIRYDLLLDDNFDFVKSAGHRGWLYSRPWNLKHKVTNRVIDWKDFMVRFATT